MLIGLPISFCFTKNMGRFQNHFSFVIHFYFRHQVILPISFSCLVGQKSRNFLSEITCFFTPLKPKFGRYFMAKLSEKFKKEWQFFLNENNRITYNEHCKKCKNNCKQSFRARIISCPNFIKRS